MPLYELFSYNVSIKYKSTLCSRATFFVALTTLIMLVFPLVLAYRSRGFWLKNYSFYEQPEVSFKYQYALLAETDDPNHVIKCGNLPNLPSTIILEDCSNIKVREVDDTFDKKMDELHFSLKIQNKELKRILTLNLFLIIDYKLDGVCPLQMEGLIFHQQEFSLPVAKHFLTANLHLNQVAPLPCWKNQLDIRFNNSVKAPFKHGVHGNWLKDLIYSYSRRNVSTKLGNKYTVTKHGISPMLEVETSVAVPEHEIRYKPGLWQELKHSWQQYLSILLIFYWIVYKIKAFVFINNMLPTWVNSPWKKYF